ncbi:polysaccharide deacetylase family protein [Couchioplanes caeruleus]|uniref:polysaccharide deacetylase family protein n=1 Tax=Couchioplanes caeruleus TaxID=56438 RepID=UPI003D3101AD
MNRRTFRREAVLLRGWTVGKRVPRRGGYQVVLTVGVVAGVIALAAVLPAAAQEQQTPSAPESVGLYDSATAPSIPPSPVQGRSVGQQRTVPAALGAPSDDRSPDQASTPTITLGFDDGTADHLEAGTMLAARGLKGVFYVNSGRLGGEKYLSVGQVQQLQSMGHEVGGHTAFHLHLSQQDYVEQRRQICFDRVQLSGLGLKVSSFAYPFSDFTEDSRRAVESCGYSNARTTSGVGCSSCAEGETSPPVDRFATRAMSGFGRSTTADDLIKAVKRVEGKSTWLQLVFHQVCVNAKCELNAVRESEFASFLDWLAAEQKRSAVRSTTARSALGDPVKPLVASPPSTAPVARLQNSSFERSGPSPMSAPHCFEYGGEVEGSKVAWAQSLAAHSGRLSLSATISSLPRPVRVMSTQDLGSCAPPVRAGRQYTVGVWYRSTEPVKLAAYVRQPRGGYTSFGGSKLFAKSDVWRYASWTTREVPRSRNTALSVAVIFSAKGSYAIDDLRLSESPAIPMSPTHIGRGSSSKQRGNREEPKPLSSSARVTSKKTAKPASQADPFTPPESGPLIPVAAKTALKNTLQGRPSWLGVAQVGLAVAGGFALVAVFDRRLRQLHRRTRFSTRSKKPDQG